MDEKKSNEIAFVEDIMNNSIPISTRRKEVNYGDSDLFYCFLPVIRNNLEAYILANTHFVYC